MLDKTQNTLCGCGCGTPTPIATRNDKAKGYIKGQPKQFCRGHHSGHGLCEFSKITLTDEQVSSTLAKFFAEGGTSASTLLGRIFRSRGTTIAAE
jgi:hypothetical protein